MGKYNIMTIETHDGGKSWKHKTLSSKTRKQMIGKLKRMGFLRKQKGRIKIKY